MTSFMGTGNGNIVPFEPIAATEPATVVTRRNKGALKNFPPRERELLTMLTYMRPAWSSTETAFIDRFIRPRGTEEDKAGNHWTTIGSGSPILWSSHTDTVHKREGKQRLLLGDGLVSAENSDCLGADCGVGVWLMCQMIDAKVPGTYVFHAGEEIGGVGSEWASRNRKNYLASLSFAIAFDRKGTDEIITHQMVGRTASDEFARSLAVALRPLTYSPSDNGTFTDTAHYSNIIPECTNIGVGYYKQHQKMECLDIRHATSLLDTILKADFSGLVCARDPLGVVEEETYAYYGGWAGNKANTKKIVCSSMKQPTSYHAWDLVDYVKHYPEDVAEFLADHGITTTDLEDAIWRNYTPDNDADDDEKGV